MKSTRLRVLHSVSIWLNLSENWIYPQVIALANVEGRVLGSGTENVETFRLSRGCLILSPPPWRWFFGIPRLFDALARRGGWSDVLATLQIRRWKPEILHAHFGNRGWASLHLQARLKIPLITSFYGYDAWRVPQTEPVWKERYRQLFKAGDAFLAEGPAMRNRLIELGCPPEKVRILRIGVDLSAFSFSPKTISSPVRIVMVGRFTEKKGLIDGLRACLEARASGVDLSVTIIGDASAEDQAGCAIKDALLKLASEPELAGRVQFTGFLPVEETRKTVQAHDIFLCPSKHASNGDAEGGSPVVLTEAMAAGLLCLGARHCDIPEVIVDGKTGWLCDSGDVKALASLIARAAREPGEAELLTAQARKHVETHFCRSRQLADLSELYASFVTDRTQKH